MDDSSTTEPASITIDLQTEITMTRATFNDLVNRMYRQGWVDARTYPRQPSPFALVPGLETDGKTVTRFWAKRQ